MLSRKHWILDENKQIQEATLMEWAMWLEHNQEARVIKQEYLWGIVDLQISTVFLGIDHNFSDEGPPILFETMMFGWPFEGHGDADYKSRHGEWGPEYQERCATYEEALAMHERARRIAMISPIWVPYRKLKHWWFWKKWNLRRKLAFLYS